MCERFGECYVGGCMGVSCALTELEGERAKLGHFLRLLYVEKQVCYFGQICWFLSGIAQECTDRLG